MVNIVNYTYNIFVKVSSWMSYTEFVATMFPNLDKLSLSAAIRCVISHSKKSVLLLVDELMNSGGKKQGMDRIKGVIYQIGACLNSIPNLNVVTTTLNESAFSNENYYAHPVEWIKLPPAGLIESKSLFGDDANKSKALAQCISDCDGHFLSLETLKLLWDEVGRKGITFYELIRLLAVK